MHKRSPLDVETYQEMYRTASQRMNYVRGGRRKSTSGQPDRRQHYTTLFHPNQSADHRCINRVSLNDRVTVYPDYDRKSPWMRMLYLDLKSTRVNLFYHNNVGFVRREK